jgi:hypothetical protein
MDVRSRMPAPMNNGRPALALCNVPDTTSVNVSRERDVRRNNLQQVASRPPIVTIAGRNIGPDPWGPLGTGNEIGAALSRGRERAPILLGAAFVAQLNSVHVSATRRHQMCTLMPRVRKSNVPSSTRCCCRCFKIDLLYQCCASPDL